MKPGITQFVQPNSEPVAFIQEAAASGYEAVELVSRQGKPLSPTASDALLAEIRNAAAAAGIEIDSLAISHVTGAFLEAGEPQELAIAQITHGLEIAAKLGARCTLITLGRVTPANYYEDAYNAAVAGLKRLAVECERTGVDIAIEFVWNGFLFSPLEFRRLLEEVGSSRIGFYFDPGNMAVFQQPQHWVRALGKHTKRVHLKDWKGNALSGGWTALLEGSVDFPVVMAELRAAGFDGSLTSEVETSLASLPDTAAAIRKIIAM